MWCNGNEGCGVVSERCKDIQQFRQHSFWGSNIQFYGKFIYLPISADNYATFKQILFLCWSLPLRNLEISPILRDL